MTADEFRAKRRQKFLTPQYYQLNLEDLVEDIKIQAQAIIKLRSQENFDPVGQSCTFKSLLNTLKIHYTAGRPIAEIKPLYADVVRALGDWHAAEHEYSKWLAQKHKENLRLDMTPLEFEDLYHYQLAMDVVSLGVLLGEGDALRQIALWMQSERGTDLLFESLLAPAVPDPRDNTDFYHLKPYDPLIDAFWTAETAEEASAKVKEYLDGWYKSFEGAPWHDGHLKGVEGEYMPYYGYWSFEAAAVCVINGIDDSSFRDHILYPKDLADWARANDSIARLKPGASALGLQGSGGRVPGGQPCPQAGWWHTPAKTGSRRYFKAGEVMPAIEGSAYGETFWLWDTHQEAPKL
ncbi:PoNe immunity protein domain-containing protein [uncultured Xanthomonas sp.]|uniref:PoNe immunity protein domain-containing protein n=1 Tax=uncultured Xanthomonas sp. TaxID=152831 RepID=UPI0025D20FE7|nr:PoNe immunity protein domain-containing protein [uncultured Xanthomonas sp.]